MALLAKQSWRLLTNANPLLTAVLKARYFKHSSVLEACRGYSPSYTWRSIWGAKSLLVEGLAWRIGNGSMVDVFNDKWIPSNNKWVAPTPMVSAPSGFSVSNLIDFHTGLWDVSALAQWFDEGSIASILAIPIMPPWSNDSMFWWLSNNGEY